MKVVGWKKGRKDLLPETKEEKGGRPSLIRKREDNTPDKEKDKL